MNDVVQMLFGFLLELTANPLPQGEGAKFPPSPTGRGDGGEGYNFHILQIAATAWLVKRR